MPALGMGRRARPLALAIVMASAATVGAASPGAPRIGSIAHASYESTDGRDGAAPEPIESTAFEAPPPLGSGGALTIAATFDSSITGDPSAAAIEAMIGGAIGVFESLFDDPITVTILFRYATTFPNGTPLPAGALAVSSKGAYFGVPWSTYVGALAADTKTTNDTAANASLPGSALSTNVITASADGRAIGLATPPVLFADGSVGAGGPYDGIVTINSAPTFSFTRPPAGGTYDAERSTEHEIDEVLGFGSFLNVGGSDLLPQDLFSWSAPGVRNLTGSGTRYFSIDGGASNVVGFNQTAGGDAGDWLSGSCPQATPFVQNAFSCAGQTSDVTVSSPEGVGLDVIGYDLITGSTTTTTVPTTTTTSTASATTTTATSSTSTTTVPSGCVIAADCDDGDPCTADNCTAGTCSHTEGTGVADVICHIQSETASPICVDGTATSVEPTVQTSEGKAVAALQGFDSASSKKKGKLRAKAEHALARILKAAAKGLKKHKVSADCSTKIKSIVSDLRSRVGAL
jgi:hypothetical protein